MVQSAISLGRRFMFDEAHAVHVARLALLLFDRLEKLHGLGARDRQLLQAAALLHDIGTFIAVKRHHKHSLYLISRSELPGLTPDENLLVANVARYHRKSHPQPHHEEYMLLPRPDRVRVDQLASILRIADALDRQHLQRVTDVDVEVRGLDLVLSCTARATCSSNAGPWERRKALFEETYGFGKGHPGERGRTSRPPDRGGESAVIDSRAHTDNFRDFHATLTDTFRHRTTSTRPGDDSWRRMSRRSWSLSRRS
jgi:exopolyphosphatase / guanosine-5'-triphosphate,3'-diphosphate pyrophosphatase